MTLRQAQDSAVAWEGKYIKVTQDGTWEYVSRTRDVTAAVILVIDEGDVLLVEQYRVPLKARCLELPAGLVGDKEEGEEIALAAIRELEEETGYRAAHMVDLGRFHASPGMSSEGFSLF
ncbi:MAG: NUDIX hydrolase, partial [Pseudomonadota bacterium]|nr:NUDIX hydrolase [Pseudomonadota bacterium]